MEWVVRLFYFVFFCFFSLFSDPASFAGLLID